MAYNFITETLAGYNAREDRTPCPFIFSSDCWLAWEAGYEMAMRGFSRPIKARKSRGYLMVLQTAANEIKIGFQGADLSKRIINRY